MRIKTPTKVEALFYQTEDGNVACRFAENQSGILKPLESRMFVSENPNKAHVFFFLGDRFILTQQDVTFLLQTYTEQLRDQND